jgi:hypothetical protein
MVRVRSFALFVAALILGDPGPFWMRRRLLWFVNRNSLCASARDQKLVRKAVLRDLSGSGRWKMAWSCSLYLLISENGKEVVVSFLVLVAVLVYGASRLFAKIFLG